MTKPNKTKTNVPKAIINSRLSATVNSCFSFLKISLPILIGNTTSLNILNYRLLNFRTFQHLFYHKIKIQINLNEFFIIYSLIVNCSLLLVHSSLLIVTCSLFVVKLPISLAIAFLPCLKIFNAICTLFVNLNCMSHLDGLIFLSLQAKVA